MNGWSRPGSSGFRVLTLRRHLSAHAIGGGAPETPLYRCGQLNTAVMVRKTSNRELKPHGLTETRPHSWQLHTGKTFRPPRAALSPVPWIMRDYIDCNKRSTFVCSVSRPSRTKERRLFAGRALNHTYVPKILAFFVQLSQAAHKCGDDDKRNVGTFV